MLKVDHLMWGAPDLDTGMRTAEALFGGAAAPGGSHPGLGTRNALVSFGNNEYLEIIAPDPDQSLGGTFGERLAALEECTLVTWAAGAADLTGLAARAELAGLGVRGPVATERATPAGDLLSWELLFLGGHQFGNLVPFFINWRDTPHPATTNPVVGSLTGFTLACPHADELSDLFARLEVAVEVEQADLPALRAEVETSNGIVTLQTTAASMGLSF